MTSFVFSCCSAGVLKINLFRDRKGKIPPPSCDIIYLKHNDESGLSIKKNAQACIARDTKQHEGCFPRRSLTLYSLSIQMIPNTEDAFIFTGGHSGMIIATRIRLSSIAEALQSNKSNKKLKSVNTRKQSGAKRVAKQIYDSESDCTSDVDLSSEACVKTEKEYTGELRRSARKRSLPQKSYNVVNSDSDRSSEDVDQ